MDPSSSTHAQTISSQGPSHVSPDATIQSSANATLDSVDQQKLEHLITEKLNTFEGVAGKQEIRQMMKDVMQEFLQGNPKNPLAQGGSGGLPTSQQALQGPNASMAETTQDKSLLTQNGASEAQKHFPDMLEKLSHNLFKSPHDKLETMGPNPFSQGAMGPLHAPVMPLANTESPQTVQVSRDAAQMIADIANQIVDRIQVNTNSLANMQEVRISFGNNILPNTDVLINLTGNQLNITFIAGSQQAAQFLSQQNLSQLQNTLKTKLGDDKTLSVSLKKEDDGENTATESTLTDQAIRRGEPADGFSGF